MQFNFFSKNGKILPIDQAVIPLSNIHYSYGFGVYETISVRSEIAYFVKQHIKRLFNSAKIISLAHPFGEDEITQYIFDLINYKKVDACNIKILLIGGSSEKDAEIFILPLSPLFLDREHYKNGVKTLTKKYERDYPQAKTLNMLGSYLAYKKAKENNCYDALLVDNDGFIQEGTRTNFFTIKDHTIFTQDEEKILPGIAREVTLKVAKKNGFNIKKVNIHLDQLSEYDSAFLTSSTSKILPIRQIDNFVFPGISDQLKSLMKKYEEFLKSSGGVFP